MSAESDTRCHVEVVADPQALASRAKEVFACRAGEAIRDRGVFRVAIPGGRTPRRLLELLGDDPQAVAWDRTHVFWTDERFVHADHADSNYRLALETFLNRVAIPASQVHPVATGLATPCDAVLAYEQVLREVFGIEQGQVPVFDLIVLGMGADGHTASLFPFSYAVTEDRDWVCMTHGTEGRHARVTLTGRVLREAHHVLVMVSGHDKAAILDEVLCARPDPVRYPIQVLWPALDRVTWMVDREARKR